MSHAVSGFTSSSPTAPQALPIAILGSDALLAAAPATPVQLAHACLRAGYSTVLPASWGDELIAAGVLRRLPNFGGGPVIQCSCPIVAHRLLTVGGDLRPALVGLVPPPVAIARYVKAVSDGTPTRVTYVGGCPGAIDESIDIRMTPDALIAMLSERGISLHDQPRVFESMIPPDRRRFYSQPGGLPSAEALWSEFGSRSIVELEGDDLASDLAQQLLTGKNVLIDVATRLGCVCSGAIPGTRPVDARTTVTTLEPPRSSTPVIDEPDSVDLDLPVPAAPRTPVDVLAVPPVSAADLLPPMPQPGGGVHTPPRGAPPVHQRVSPVRGISEIIEPRQPRQSGPSRSSGATSQRLVFGSVPVARASEGKSLPRAFFARRRSSPKGTATIPPAMQQAPDDLEAQTASAVLTPPHDAPAIRDEPRTLFDRQPLPPLVVTAAPISALPVPATPIVKVAAPAVSSTPQRPLILPAELEAAMRDVSLTPEPRPATPRAHTRPHAPSQASSEKPSHPSASKSPSLSGRQTIVALIAVLVIALTVGTAVAVIVARSLREPALPAASSVPR